MSHQIIGTGGFITWFYAFIYMRVVRASKKNIFVRILVHSIGLVITILGLFYLFSTMPSSTSIFGLFLGFIGIVIYVIPFGINANIKNNG